LATLNGADLAGRQRFDLLARLTFFSSLVLVVGQTAGARFFGVPGALMGTAAGALLPALYGLGLLRGSSRTGPVPAALGSRVWRYAANTWLAAMVSAIIWSRAEIFFLERYRGSGEVSSFAVGVALSSLASQGPLLLMGAFLPHFSQLRGAGERPAIAAAYASGTRLVALLLFPLSFGIAAVVPVLLPLVYGAGYSAAVPVATALLMLASLGFANIGSSLMYAYERSRFIAMAGVVGAVVSVGAWLLLVPAFGAEGAVLVRAALQVSMIALATWYIVRVLGFPFPMASLGRTLLAAMASALTMRLTITFSQTALGLLAAGTLGLASYLLAARWLRVVEEEDARRIQAMTGRLPGLLARPLGHVIAWLSPGA
jgi:O-antigen/teichoic acid export membrane protein